MTDLDELIAAEREHPPAAEPDEVKANWKRISASAAAGVPLPVDLSPAAVKVTASSKLAALVASTTAKVTIAVTLVGGGTVAVVANQPEEPSVAAATAQDDETPKRSQALAEPADTTVPAPTPPLELETADPVEVEVQTPQETSPSAAGTNNRRRPRPRPATKQQEQDIAGEVALIQAAQRSLRAHDPQSALQNLRTHRQRYPEGTMSEDRLALRVLALCAAQRHDEGIRARTEFLRSWPKSIYIDRVRQACDQETPKSD